VAIIRGQVFDPEGRPLAEAAVYVVSAPAAMPDIAQLTDGEGRFSLNAPAPGTYTFGARSDAFGQAQNVVEVGGEEPAAVEIRFARPTNTAG
jgi:hypothetical protein